MQLGAELAAARTRRAQVEVEAGTAIAAVTKLGQGRRLEAFAPVRIQAHISAWADDQAGHRRGCGVVAAAAVVGVARADIAIVDPERERTAAPSDEQRPGLGRCPLQLGVLVETAHAIGFVAAQGAAHAERVADEILVAAALLLEILEAGADGELESRAAPGPAQVGAAIVAIEVDHAAAAARGGLGENRNGEELGDLATPGIGEQAPVLVCAERLFPDRPALALADLLARIEQARRGRGLARILGEFLAAQSERILGLGNRQRIGEHGQACAVGGLPAQPGIRGNALGRAVLAIAVRAEAAQVEVAVERTEAVAPVEAGACVGVAAAGQAEAPLGRISAVRGEQLDHAGRGISVERRERTAQDLDALGRIEVEMRNLAGAIGHRGRNAIAVEAHAAHAEGRARTESADRNLFVLGQVLAVAHEQSGNEAEHFREIHPEAIGGGRIDAHGIDRGGHLEGRLAGARRRDHDCRQRRIAIARGFSAQPCRLQHGQQHG